MPDRGGALPLSPYRVLDLSGPNGFLAGKMLGDLGADVIKIEPPAGDPARNVGPFYHDEIEPEKNLRWFAFNANKRGITVNIDTADGQAVIQALAAEADFLIETFPPGHMEQRGLGYAALKGLNPGLVYVAITPFGQTGPRRDWKGTDLTLIALGGQMHLSGNEERAPVRISVEQSYPQAGAQAALAALIAHQHRRRTGQGQFIDVSVQEAIANTMINVQPTYEIGGRLYHRGARTLWGPVYQRQVWPCRDGYIAWKWFVARGRGRRNDPVVAWMKEAGMETDLDQVDFEGKDLMKLNQQEVDDWEEQFGAFFKSKSKRELYDGALERRIMLFPVSTPADIFDNPQVQARNFLEPVEHPELNDTIKYPGAWVQATDITPHLRRRAPLIGEHNIEVFVGELGLSREELWTLREVDAI